VRDFDAMKIDYKKNGPARSRPESIGGLNRTRNNSSDPVEPRGAGGLRNPALVPDRTLK